MGTIPHFKTGKIFYAIALLAIGIIHVVTHNFPKGLLPVPATVPGRITFVYISGISMIVVALFMLIKPNSYLCALLAVLLWSLLLVLVHLPLLLPHLKDGGEWAATLEVLAFMSGALVIAGIQRPKAGLSLIRMGTYLFAGTLIGFGVLHYIYLDYLTTLVPAWLPGKVFFAWLVMFAFFAASISLLVRWQVKLAMDLLSLMFFVWVLILHAPRAIKINVETEWTSLFVALAMSGIAQLVYAGFVNSSSARNIPHK